MPSLKKTDRNDGAGFNYVSIDNYYEAVAKLCLDQGLLWSVTETEYQLFEKGPDTMVRAVYSFTIYTDDGDVVPDFSRITSVLPFSDAQTTGIALSYAEKIFMRTCFKVVTGEKDADAYAKAKQPAFKKAVPKLVEPGLVKEPQATPDVLVGEIEACKSTTELKQWGLMRRSALAGLKANSEEDYAYVRGVYSDTNNAFEMKGTTSGQQS